ncbi:MAG: hypothetical protein IKU33_01440 [Bacteroidales bacterium]|nr:hypothetical protein [Bacteroidales bacterium]
MKKSIFAFAAALAALVACNKNDMAPMQPQNQETLEPCELTVGICGAMTRATTVTADNEAKVNNLQVFVFRGDDLDAYASVDNAQELTLSCTAGERVVYALVNAPDYSAVPGKAALLAKVSELSANSLANFEMVGSKSVTLPQSEKVSIDVNRIASRVVLKKITRNFTSEALQALNFKVDAIYLINVAGNTSYDLSAAPAKWYNLAENKSELASLLYDAPASLITNGQSYSTAHTFYAYPNDLAVNTTRLVIETTLGETKYYYPINLPEMAANKSYEIEEVKITRPGSDNPDEPVSFADATFSINVIDWTVVPVTEGTTI